MSNFIYIILGFVFAEKNAFTLYSFTLTQMKSNPFCGSKLYQTSEGFLVTLFSKRSPNFNL